MIPPARRAHRPAPTFLDQDGPIAMAHRGFSLDGHENSMSAFAAAVDLGYRYVETDVHATSDGRLVAFHDATLDRVTDALGAIAELPWREVTLARIGTSEPIPLFEDLLGTWPQLRVNVDVKSRAAVQPLVQAIERTRAHDRVLVASFSDRSRRAVLRRLSAPVATSGGPTTVAAFRTASMAGRTRLAGRALRDVDCLQLPESFGRLRVVTHRTVAHAHRAGVQVHVWTVNETEDMHRLLDLGVDGLITDRADLLRDVLRDRGAWPG
ncbi:glycerophosphodiester phosphodiesterase [Segeticoccus rhizosphaerae]|uniref:glycerophosphodiester phosphodiesterase n=3 Tax=Segeticoccus rhizosphaerae TaxID=1104777 RepID=UPI003083707B